MIRDEKPLRLIVSVVFYLKDNNKEQIDSRIRHERGRGRYWGKP